MCLNPVNIINPRKNLSLYGGLPYKIEVPCGQCADCKKSMQSEWYFRCYYESKWTFDNDGYVLFDTLTYDNAHLPHVSDFCPELKGRVVDTSCFNVEHYRLFLVNLRRQLSYHGFDPAGKIKYFLTSEYGVDDRFTHRPHYHILFFVTDKTLDPLVLSEYISKCWPFGRTDGIPFKTPKYVLDHVFSKCTYNSDQVHLQSVCNYVAKYVTKDSSFQKTIEVRLNRVFDIKYGKDSVLTDRQKKERDRLRRCMNQFHRQSKGFGDKFFLYNDMNQVLSTGMISMPDKNKVVKHIPLPGYYSRKLFYDLVRDFEGHLRWEINELGIKFKLSHKLKSIELFKLRFDSWHYNMQNHAMALKVGYRDEDGHVWTADEVNDWYSSHVDEFDKYLNGRDLQDFVIYLLCYKGRLKTPEQVDRELKGEYFVEPLDRYVLREFAPEQVFGHEQVYNYAHKVYRDAFGSKFVTDKDLGSVDLWRKEGVSGEVANWFKWRDFCTVFNGYVPSIRKNKYFGHMMTIDGFVVKYVMDDKCDPRFKDFDKMYWLWCDSLKYSNVEKQKYYDWRQDSRNRLKSIGILKSSV